MVVWVERGMDIDMWIGVMEFENKNNDAKAILDFVTPHELIMAPHSGIKARCVVYDLIIVNTRFRMKSFLYEYKYIPINYIIT